MWLARADRRATTEERRRSGTWKMRKVWISRILKVWKNSRVESMGEN